LLLLLSLVLAPLLSPIIPLSVLLSRVPELALSSVVALVVWQVLVVVSLLLLVLLPLLPQSVLRQLSVPVLVSVLVLTSVSKNVLRLEGSSDPSFFK
jgi:hypothetical protein